MLNIEKPFEDGAMRLVRVHVNGQSALVTARVSMAQKALIISDATRSRLVKKFGSVQIKMLDPRCTSEWKFLICVE